MYDLSEPLLSVGVLQQKRKSVSIQLKNKQSPPTSKHEEKSTGASHFHLGEA